MYIIPIVGHFSYRTLKTLILIASQINRGRPYTENGSASRFIQLNWLIR